MKKIINITFVLIVTFITFITNPLFLPDAACHAENVIIIRRENKKGQGADIEIRPERKRGKIEIRTRI